MTSWHSAFLFVPPTPSACVCLNPCILLLTSHIPQAHNTSVTCVQSGNHKTPAKHQFTSSFCPVCLQLRKMPTASSADRSADEEMDHWNLSRAAGWQLPVLRDSPSFYFQTMKQVHSLLSPFAVSKTDRYNHRDIASSITFLTRIIWFEELKRINTLHIYQRPGIA